MSSAQKQLLVDVPAPSYKTVADNILAIASQMRADGHEQETIRVALHGFVESVKASPALTERNPF
jgi:hypothetical protein